MIYVAANFSLKHFFLLCTQQSIRDISTIKVAVILKSKG